MSPWIDVNNLEGSSQIDENFGADMMSTTLGLQNLSTGQIGPQEPSGLIYKVYGLFK